MASTVRNIGKSIANATGTNSIYNAINNATGADNAASSFDNAFGMNQGKDSDGGLSGLTQKGARPIDPVQSIHDQNMSNAKQFRDEADKTKSILGHRMTVDSNNQTNSAVHQSDQNVSNRGLLYGGYNQGQQGLVRAKSQGALATGLNAVNSAVDSTAADLDKQALDTATLIQKNKQALQDQAYSRALANQNSNQAALGQFAGTVATVALL